MGWDWVSKSCPSPIVLVFCVWTDAVLLEHNEVSMHGAFAFRDKGVVFNLVCILVYTFASVHFNFSSCSYCRCLQGGALNSWVFKTSGVSLCFQGIMHSLRWTDCSVWFSFPEHNINSCEKRDLRNPYSKCLRFSSFSSLLLLFLLNDFPADHPHEFPVCCCGESFQRKRQSHHTRSTDRY